jgi:hypothetical protein
MTGFLLAATAAPMKIVGVLCKTYHLLRCVGVDLYDLGCCKLWEGCQPLSSLFSIHKVGDTVVDWPREPVNQDRAST